MIRLTGFDLNPFLNKVADIYNNSSLLNFIYIIVIVTTIILIILRVIKYILKTFLIELAKRHLYLLRETTRYNIKLKNNWLLYNRLTFCFFIKFSYLHLKNYIFGKIVMNKLLYYIGKVLNFPDILINKIRISLGKFLLILLKIIPTLLLVILFMYDLWYNNLIITKVFYYLIFYSIFNIWKRYSDFLENYDRMLGEILFDLYYRDDTIMYVNLPDEWENLLHEFVNNGLQNYNKDLDTVAMYLEIGQYKYISKDGRFYWNSTGGFDKENL
jgi:hypothetical protein